MKIRTKKILTFFAVAGLLLTYGMIFSFSADNAEESSALSQKVTDIVLKMYRSLFQENGLTNGVLTQAGSGQTETVVRKLAHFTEYSVVGFLSFLLVLLWLTYLKRGIGLVFLQLLISASLDEIHQYFVPGRHSSMRDVLIDTAGGLTGALLIYLLSLLWKQSQKKRRTS